MTTGTFKLVITNSEIFSNKNPHKTYAVKRILYYFFNSKCTKMCLLVTVRLCHCSDPLTDLSQVPYSWTGNRVSNKDRV